MNRVVVQIKKHWKTNLLTFIISIVVGVGIFCLIFFLRNMALVDAVNGAAVGSLSVLLFGLLMWVSHLGAFDTFVFGFKQLGSMFFAKDARRDGNYADYKQNKAESRANSSYNFVAVIAAGLFLSIALIVLEIIYHASLGA